MEHLDLREDKENAAKRFANAHNLITILTLLEYEYFHVYIAIQMLHIFGGKVAEWEKLPNPIPIYHCCFDLSFECSKES